MKTWGKATVSGILLGLTGGLAATASADTGSNPPEQVYAGPVLGYDNVVLSDMGYSVNRGGLTYGGLVGVDTPVGNHGRVGAEAQITGSTAALTVMSGNVTDKAAAGVDMFFGGKLGWMVTPHFQAFSRIGYAYSRFTVSESLNGIKVAQAAANLSGFRVGVGGEYFLSKNVRARVEYDYTHYGEVHAYGEDLGFKMERHQVTAGLLYGF
jgi:outer membrane immunogenic protein